jgi:hypothetical protein
VSDDPLFDRLKGRCGSCARFVRVVESVDQNGEVRRAGDCLLGVWPSPLYETNTCSQYVQRGNFQASLPARVRMRNARPRSLSARSPGFTSGSGSGMGSAPRALEIPEELLDMDADEFRAVLREVIRDELGVTEVEMGGRWSGGEVVLKPGKEGTQEKRIPIESLFHKVVMIRDKLRVLEQKINANPKLLDEEKLQMQQYVTACYGSLTTFNVLFADKSDQFSGQKGDD